MSAFLPAGHSQEDSLKKLTLEGYVSSMQSVIYMDSLQGYWYYESQIHNRLNVGYYPTSHISMALQARNRFITGDRFKSDAAGDIQNLLQKMQDSWILLSTGQAEGPMF